MPYFAYTTCLHLYETMGWWRTAELRRVHFAEAGAATFYSALRFSLLLSCPVLSSPTHSVLFSFLISYPLLSAPLLSSCLLSSFPLCFSSHPPHDGPDHDSSNSMASYDAACIICPALCAGVERAASPAHHGGHGGRQALARPLPGRVLHISTCLVYLNRIRLTEPIQGIPPK